MVRKSTKKAPETYEGDDIDQILEVSGIETKKAPIKVRHILWCAIIGVGRIAAIISIAYTSYRVIVGTDDLYSKLLVIPQIVLGVAMMLRAFVYDRIKSLMEK